MGSTEETPEQSARQLFLITLAGIALYAAAVFIFVM